MWWNPKHKQSSSESVNHYAVWVTEVPSEEQKSGNHTRDHQERKEQTGNNTFTQSKTAQPVRCISQTSHRGFHIFQKPNIGRTGKVQNDLYCMIPKAIFMIYFQ